MRSTMRAPAVFACVVLFFFLCGPPFSRAAEPTAADTPEQLVRAALESELNGPSDDRARLLAAALALDPNFAPARWHSGFVRIGDEWIKIDDVPNRVGNDPQLARYRQKRDALVDTADNQRKLARWCHKNRLPDEERIHWIKVLEFDQQDAEALSALGLHLYNGRLLTRQQIEQEKAKAGKQLRATRKWHPRFVKWRAAIERGKPAKRDAALEQLRNFNDPAGVQALEGVFGIEGDSEKVLEINQLLFDTLLRFPNHDATQILIRRAVLAESKAVRSAAARALRLRTPSSFVPQLVAALPCDENLKTWHAVYALPDGTVIREHGLFVYDFKQERLKFRGIRDTDRAVGPLYSKPLRIAPRLWRATNQIAAYEARLELTRQDLQERIEAALVEAAGFQRVNSPEQWLNQLDAHYDTYTLARPPKRRPESEIYSRVRFTFSCFPAGTRIQTLSGPADIETIQPGDWVLSQNPVTGELAFKTIQAVTLRPPAPLVEIGIGSETIRATRGHPFWVNGEGWRMAKHVSVGVQLHAIGGAVTIDRIAEARAKEAYNLVVSDFGTYFVGDSQVLVHHNLPLGETVTLVPGLSRRTDVPETSPVTIR